MKQQLSQLVTRNSGKVVLGWFALTVLLYLAAPRWHSITDDGDFAYLPEEMPSVAGEKLVSEAFPAARSKSQIALLIAREDSPLTAEDRKLICADLGRRIQYLQGSVSLAAYQADPTGADSELALETASQAFQEAIVLDQILREAAATREIQIDPLVDAYQGRVLTYRIQDEAEEAEKLQSRIRELAPEAKQYQGSQADLPLLDVWTWRDRFFGKRLGQNHRHFRLLIIQLENEFMAVDNIAVIQAIEHEIKAVKETFANLDLPQIALSGSAVVGTDMLLAAKSSISQTEVVTIILVIGILAFVYRAPLLVLVPLISIGIALSVSSSLIALFVQAGQGYDWQWRVFSTTRIFLVVILFGAGTDYCLFLIARYREELSKNGNPHESVERATTRVSEALLASAMTTVLGLAMMYFADFGKFRFSGPVISFALLVTVFVTLTLTPALLRICGSLVFWPFPVAAARPTTTRRRSRSVWATLSRSVVRTPARILVGCLVIMLPFFVVGIRTSDTLSYDVLASLPRDCRSRQGMALMKQFLPPGEDGPITIVCRRNRGELASLDGKQAISELAAQLYKLPSVKRVRTIDDPLGELGPNQQAGVLTSRGFAVRLLRAHRRVRSAYVTERPGLKGKVARLDVILGLNPFSIEAMSTLDDVEALLNKMSQAEGSFWEGTEFSFAGTTAGIRDLRQVTQSDYARIEWLVVAAVMLVLLLILRHPLVCLYMILTILFTYYVTMGVTQLVFQFAMGDAYLGLDWKVPLFVFVILVAVGQDYNVYLATRVLEEQKRMGPFRGLQAAIISTGGIITSCGMIMAGTFLSMTSASWRNILVSWFPVLQTWLGTDHALVSIVQLGFALSLGICLDTFVVRPILLPACLSLSLHVRRAFLSRRKLSAD